MNECCIDFTRLCSAARSTVCHERMGAIGQQPSASVSLPSVPYGSSDGGTVEQRFKLTYCASALRSQPCLHRSSAQLKHSGVSNNSRSRSTLMHRIRTRQKQQHERTTLSSQHGRTMKDGHN